MVTRLSHDELTRLHAAEQAAAARSNAHLAVMVLPASERYTLYPLVYGALAAIAVLAVLAIFWPDVSLRDGFFATAIAYGITSLILEWPPLKLAVVPKKIKHHHAGDMAHRVFAARILAHAGKKPGVLLFASLGERHLELIADRSVHARVSQAEWDTVMKDLSDAARRGRLVDGLLGAAEDCTKMLEKHFPAQ